MNKTLVFQLVTEFILLIFVLACMSLGKFSADVTIFGQSAKFVLSGITALAWRGVIF